VCLIAKAIRISLASFIAIDLQLTTVQDIKNYTSLIFGHTWYSLLLLVCKS